jgi:hypothetical protein
MMKLAPGLPPPPPMPVICDTCRAHGTAGNGAFAGITDILNFEPVPRRTQVNNWTPELQRAFIAALALTGSARRAGKAIGRHEIGAEKLRKARGGKSFSDAWDAALEIYRDREMARLGDQMAELSNARAEAVARLDLKPGERDPDEEMSEFDEAKQRIRERLLNARRLLLGLISGDPEKRKAWEVLAGPVDWEKAKDLKPQDNEPFGVPNMRRPDMVLAAESGLIHDVVGAGRDRRAELEEAVNEVIATGQTDGPAMQRFCAEE